MKSYKFACILGLCFWFPAYGIETLEVEYASFYSHVKKLDTPDTDALRFGFGFRHIVQDRLCHVTGAKIVTEKQTIPLSVESNNRFTVPVDKVLKMAKAMVSIDINDQANQCDMSVQLETLPRYLQRKYSHQELQLLFAQYQAFFQKMGSFLSFMMPSATGVVLHFQPEIVLPENLRGMLNSEGNIVLDHAWFSQNKGLALPVKPLRITALIEK